MAVYREGFTAIREYNQEKDQIFVNAGDIGVRVKKGDHNWSNMMTLVEMYGEKETRKKIAPNQVSIEFTLIDEWAVSDERKTVKEATERYSLLYHQFTKGDKYDLKKVYQDMDGVFTITRLN